MLFDVVIYIKSHVNREAIKTTEMCHIFRETHHESNNNRMTVTKQSAGFTLIPYTCRAQTEKIAYKIQIHIYVYS